MPDSSDHLRQSLIQVEALIGNTPTVPLQHDGIRLFAKLEYKNFTGSIKDRTALFILKNAVECGRLTKQSVVVESSSGNFAISLAVLCARMGITFIPVIDPTMNPLVEKFLCLLCSRVERVTQRDENGNFLLTRLQRVRQVLTEFPDSFWPNQYENQCNVDAHYYGTGGEICSQFNCLDFMFIGVSTGGTLAGVSRRIKERFPGVRIIAVEPLGSVIFGGKPAKRWIPGLGSSRSSLPFPRCAQYDEVLSVSESETVEGCMELLHGQGIWAGGSSGTVFAGIKKYFASHPVSGHPTVLFLCPDGGERYVDTVYNDAWVRGHINPAHVPLSPAKLHAVLVG